MLPATTAALLAACLIPAAWAESKTLTDADKIDILRGIEAEYGKAKVLIPRSKKPLPYHSNGAWDARQWVEMSGELGPAARVGDLVQITKITFDNDRIVLQLNHGWKGGSHWYDHVQVGMADPTMPMPGVGGGTSAPGGTSIVVLFHEKIPSLQSAELKKILAPVIDFDQHSATKDYVSSLPPAVKTAIQEKRAVNGMDRDQVLLAMGRPRTKDRQTRDGVDYEDWIYGAPPGKITFVTFQGSKVVKVKEEYAGLGGSTVPDLQPQD